MEARDLFIMRHAKSDWNNELISDFDRPLNERGMKDAPRMARWLAERVAENNKALDFLISSPALRAKQTTSEITSHLNLPESVICYDERMYLANVETLLNIVRETDNKHKSIMLVGHNPGLENLAVNLSKEQIPIGPDGSLMTTANIIHLQVKQPWDSLALNDAEFVQLMRPKQLP